MIAKSKTSKNWHKSKKKKIKTSRSRMVAESGRSLAKNAAKYVETDFKENKAFEKIEKVSGSLILNKVQYFKK